MGKRFAPAYANIFMAKWEKEAIEKCPIKPTFYFRFQDDILLGFPGDEAKFLEMFNILNNHHPSIKLKYEINTNMFNFLDITGYKGERWRKENILDLKVYFKPTDTHALLHSTSFHPKHTFSGVFKSQIIRFHRICNNNKDFQEACTTLRSALRPRGYSKRLMNRILSQTLEEFEQGKLTISEPKTSKPLGTFQSCQNKTNPFVKFANHGPLF